VTFVPERDSWGGDRRGSPRSTPDRHTFERPLDHHKADGTAFAVVDGPDDLEAKVLD